MMFCLKEFNEIATLKESFNKNGCKLNPKDISIIKNASVVIDNEKILWVGKHDELPSLYKDIPSKSFKGKVLTPELVDTHTHLVFGGNRSKEYTMRLNGADYQEIAKAGGGILSTMKGTNEASRSELLAKAIERINRIYSYGVGTIEIKSGYGLNYEKEKELTLLIAELKEIFKGKVQIINTYMAAHAIPKEYDSSKSYLDKVVIPLLKELAPLKIIDCVDIFFEQGYFNKEDTIRLFEEATSLGINKKVHADEFNDNKGAILAAQHNAVSCDHLLCTTEDGIKALAESDTIATLLPGTGFFLGKSQADGRSLLDNGVKVAIATDYNPGSCHSDNLILTASLAAPTYKMNIAELWTAITLNASRALGLKNQGAIVEGLDARFTIFNVESIDEITYSWGRNFAIRD